MIMLTWAMMDLSRSYASCRGSRVRSSVCQLARLFGVCLLAREGDQAWAT